MLSRLNFSDINAVAALIDLEEMAVSTDDLKKMSLALKKVANEIERLASRRSPVLVFGRDAEVLYYMLLNREVHVEYAEISRLVVSNRQTRASAAQAIRSWAEMFPGQLIVVDTGYKGSIFDALQDEGLSLEGRLLVSESRYKEFPVPFSTKWLTEIEALPKFTARAVEVGPDMATTKTEANNRDAGIVCPLLAMVAIRTILRYAGEGTKVAIRALWKRRGHLVKI